LYNQAAGISMLSQPGVCRPKDTIPVLSFTKKDISFKKNIQSHAEADKGAAHRVFIQKAPCGAFCQINHLRARLSRNTAAKQTFRLF
jgi:hypothetical protein